MKRMTRYWSSRHVGINIILTEGVLNSREKIITLNTTLTENSIIWLKLWCFVIKIRTLFVLDSSLAIKTITNPRIPVWSTNNEPLDSCVKELNTYQPWNFERHVFCILTSHTLIIIRLNTLTCDGPTSLEALRQPVLQQLRLLRIGLSKLYLNG